MGTRGRKSASELAVVPVAIPARRPPPPSGLREDEKEVWRDVTATMPGGWFTKAQFPVLIAYCRHSARAADLAKQINCFEPEWLLVDGGIARLEKLLGMATRETNAMLACARSMRLTHQAQIYPRGAGRRLAGSGSRPWEDADFLDPDREPDEHFGD